MTAPSPPPGPEQARGSSKMITVLVPLLVALIAAVASVVVAIINRPSAPPTPGPTPTVEAAPPTAGVKPGTGGASGTCFSFSTAGGANAPVVPNPQASTHDVSLSSASFALNRQARPPTILIAGQVMGLPPAGSHLWLVGNPDPRTRDIEGNAGSGRFYPAAQIQPDANGCWRNPPQSIGYDEAIGITVTQLLVQVNDAATAEFTNHVLHPDGLSDGDMSRLGVDTIAFFEVPTNP